MKNGDSKSSEQPWVPTYEVDQWTKKEPLPAPPPGCEGVYCSRVPGFFEGLHSYVFFFFFLGGGPWYSSSIIDTQTLC